MTVRLNPVSTIITLAARIADEHPRAAQLAYRIRAEADVRGFIWLEGATSSC